jgi:hypothetical protein
MSFKKIGTAGDLMRFGCSLRIECTHCAAANTMSAIEVVKRCCAGGDIEQFRRRLKCARCGRKAARLIVLDPL